MGLIGIHKPKCIIYIILISIINTLVIYIRKYLKDYFHKNPFFRLFCLFFSEIFSIFLYLFQKISSKSENKEKQYKKIKKKSCFTFGILLFCTILSGLSDFDYSYFYSYQISKIENFSLEIYVLFLYIVIIEQFIFGTKFYKHQIISIYISLILGIINIIRDLYRIKISNYKFLFIIPFYILFYERHFINGVYLCIIKKLNIHYFYNMNLILFIQGLIGSFIFLIYELFNFLFFHRLFFLMNLKNINTNHFIKDLILLSIYFFLVCILNFLIFKIIEDTKPSYVSISYALSDFLMEIYLNIIERESKLGIYIIINYILSIVSFCFFCEVITLNCFDLDKDTVFKIIERSSIDAKTEIMLINENEDYERKNSIFSF